MPYNAPVIKRQATEGYGAEVVEYNPDESDRKALAEDLAQKHGYTIIPPFDHPNIIAGQGTAAMEFYDEIKSLDYLITPCGGGGLLSGTAVASKNICPSCKVIGVEPELANDAVLSFKTGKLHTVKNPPTIADGARTPSLGDHTFPLVLKYVDDMIEVTEQAIIDTVKFLFYRMKLVVEPSGALGLSAILSNKIQVSGRVGVIISGGNIDNSTMKTILDS
jgi:threonine dehydratase